MHDAAIVLSIIAGFDMADLTTRQSLGHLAADELMMMGGLSQANPPGGRVDCPPLLFDRKGLKGARLGILRDMFRSGRDHEESLAIIDLVEGFPAGSGDVHVDGSGLVYVSGFFFGTVVWDSGIGAFIRGPDNPVCAPLAGGGCRGASSSYAASDGTLYQTFFGSAAQGLQPWVFRYEPETFQLADSIATGLGSSGLEIHAFRQP